jgi:hypothetical protein
MYVIMKTAYRMIEELISQLSKKQVANSDKSHVLFKLLAAAKEITKAGTDPAYLSEKLETVNELAKRHWTDLQGPTFEERM